MTGSGSHYSGELGRVGTTRAEDVTRVKFIIKLVWAHIIRRIGILCASIVNKMADDAVARKLLKPVGNVFPEKKFRKGKLREPYFRLHFPTREIAHGLAEDSEHTANIHTAVVFG